MRAPQRAGRGQKVPGNWSRRLPAPDKSHDQGPLYAVNYETNDGWKYNLRLGPMMKSQWFQTTLYEPGIYQRGEEGEETFDKYRALFPSSSCSSTSTGFGKIYPRRSWIPS